jgi:hypothetical protein
VARVTLGSGAVAVTDKDGYFAFDRSQAEAGSNPTRESTTERKLDLTVEAAGYALWSISGAVYYESDTLRLYPKLDGAPHEAVEVFASQPRHGLVPPGKAEAQQFAPLQTDGAEVFSEGTEGDGEVQPQGVAAAPGALPASIRVYRTGSGVVEVVPFREYVKHVLPNEWISSWAPESLKAGAMAVKHYAWYWVSRGGKQVALGADVKDNTDDQVYDPNLSYASTDAAVDATFEYVMTINGALFPAQYCAGAYDPDPAGDCPWNSRYMTQWGSAYYADQGRPFGWILQFYYTGARITPSPPGGGYDGSPPPSNPPPSAPPPSNPPPPSGGNYAVGQGATQPGAFIDAYDRNGGAAVFGTPVTPVRWWLQYVTEYNVVAQRFSGADGQGNTWIVFDVLKVSSLGVTKAYMLTGNIAAEYAAHTPPGPEWVGAPISDPYKAAGGKTAQQFRRGTLLDTGNGVQLVAEADAQPDAPAAPTIAPAAPPPPAFNKNGQASMRVRVQWLGRGNAPSDLWTQPLTLLLSAPGDPAILGRYEGTTDRNGVALYSNLPPGKFDVHVKGPHSLQSARAAIGLADNATADIDMKVQIEGDVDGDNCVTIDDFSLVQGFLGTNKDMAGFDPKSDLNGDGVVTMADISLLRSGFERCGDVSADAEFRTMSSNSSPTLSEALIPWTNPSSQQHTLSLSMTSSAATVNVGQIVRLDVVAQAGGQPVDGAAFVINYDAHRFAPVDSSGNPAFGMEPGVALPAVMGNWIDTAGGSVGYATGILQGQPPTGRIVLGSLRFRALPSVGTGPALFAFAPAPSPVMQLTNGGENLLARGNDLTISVVP